MISVLSPAAALLTSLPPRPEQALAAILLWQ